MPEDVSKISQITGRSHIPVVSVDVLYLERIEGLQPCCLQFSGVSREHFVVGTYNLENPRTQSRNGSLLLYHLHDTKLILLETFVYSSGVLDIKFNNSNGQKAEKFAAASSTGSISIFKLENPIVTGSDGIKTNIVHLDTFQVFPESILITSLAWHSSSDGPIAVSSSDGQVAILSFSDDYTILKNTTVINNHGDSEAWVVAFSMDWHRLLNDNASFTEYDGRPWRTPALPQGVYSGGDDSRLRFALFSCDTAGTPIREQASSNQQGGGKGLGGHYAGVTAILRLPIHTLVGHDILLTGSYDEHVRVYAIYDGRLNAEDKKPKVMAELNVGGGVWRLTFLDDYAKKGNDGSDLMYRKRIAEVNSYRVLASCMQGGVRILEVTGCLHGEWSIKVIADLNFNTPNDLVYAGDVQPAGHDTTGHDLAGKSHGMDYVLVSANFYEQQLCVWRFYEPTLPVSPKTVYLTAREAESGLNQSN